MSEELKPCPFCGGKADRHTIEDEEPSNAGGDVICCSRCGASSHVEFGRKENLVSVWNTRPELTTLRAENELMREVVSDLLPRGVCWDNPNIPDNTVIPVDMTMGEIRKARNALAQVAK